MATLFADARLALRLLVRNPGFSAAAVLTLALGLGATAAIFTVVNAVLLRPLPYAAPDRIVMVYQSSERSQEEGHSSDNFRDLGREARAFEALAGYREDVYTVVDGGDPERLDGAQVTSSFFDVFGMPALTGRLFSAASDKPGDRLAVVSESAWRGLFGGRADLAGRTVRFNGVAMTVVGVVPASFRWPTASTRVWVLADADVPSSPLEGGEGAGRGLHYFEAVGRIRPDVNLEAARSEADAIGQRLAEAFPGENRGRSFRLVPLHQQIVGNVRATLWMLLAVVGLVLLIACANVANLLLARATGRGREMAIRASLGASGGRLAAQLLTESLVLALAGGAVGLLVGEGVIALFVRLLPETFPRGQDVWVDGRVLLVSTIVTLGTGVLFGLAPALLAWRLDLAEAVKAGGRTSGSTSPWLRRLLVTGQTALATVVLAGAALFVASLLRLQQVDTGVRASHVITIDLALPQAQYPDKASQLAFYRAVHERVAALPRTRSAAVGFPMPFGGGGASGLGWRRADRPREADAVSDRALLATVTPGFFATLGVPIVAGRDFTSDDTLEGRHPVIISKTLADRYWPGENPLDKQIFISDDEPSTIVGIAGDVRREAVETAPKPTVYLPYQELMLPFLSLAVRTSGPPAEILPDVRAIVRAQDPSLALGEVHTLDEQVARSIAQPRFRTWVVASLALLALAIAAIGVYGVVAYSVSRRVRELGIRLALGSSPSQVLRLVTLEGVRLALAGVGVGLVGALALGRFVASLLFEVQPGSPLALAATATALVAAALVASVVPALRAARIDPIEALRQE